MSDTIAIYIIMDYQLYWSLLSETDFCDPNPCLNDGECDGFTGGFNCTCKEGFYGKICQNGR